MHRSAWPSADEIRQLARGEDGELLATTADLITAVRKAKSEAQGSMCTDVAISGCRAELDRVVLVQADARAAVRIGALEQQVDDSSLTVKVVLQAGEVRADGPRRRPGASAARLGLRMR